MSEAQPMKTSCGRERTAVPDRRGGPRPEVYAHAIRIRFVRTDGKVAMTTIRKLNQLQCYLTAPAVSPRTMCFSMITPITTNGVIAAVARAAIDHQRVPCELVCPASRSGSVGASAPARTTAKKYSFQE